MKFNVGKFREGLPKDFDIIRFSLAYPEKILSWS